MKEIEVAFLFAHEIKKRTNPILAVFCSFLLCVCVCHAPNSHANLRVMKNYQTN